jgi:uncharacterized damage-inducible protein DinB
MLIEHYRAMARYNHWMNRRLYDASARLSEADRSRDVGAFFKSVRGTLNHILLADRGWLGRLTGDPARSQSLAADGSVIPVTGLEQELYTDFDELRRQREKTDGDIGAWVESLTEAALSAPLRYRNTSGQEFEHPAWFAASHFFNHQTHHRGQVTALLLQLGVDPGVTDLVHLLRTEAAPAPP